MSRGTPRRSVRLPDPLWLRLLAVADDRRTDPSSLIRAAIVAYLRRITP